MKWHYLIIVFQLLLLSCNEQEEPGTWQAPARDTIPPVTQLQGQARDTAFLHTSYFDSRISVMDEIDGVMRCVHDAEIEVTGEVDTRFPGNYILSYTAKDYAGNVSSPKTRTVTVTENHASFLNGGYQVVYTATAATRGTSSQTITTDTYSAIVTPFHQQNAFDLNSLEVGDEFVKPSTVLLGNVIEVSFYSPSYSYQSTSTGTLSPAKDSFTIETTAYLWNPPINYKCRNIYTKMKLEEIKNHPKSRK